jgi:hypothetical protein
MPREPASIDAVDIPVHASTRSKSAAKPQDPETAVQPPKKMQSEAYIKVEPDTPLESSTSTSRTRSRSRAAAAAESSGAASSSSGAASSSSGPAKATAPATEGPQPQPHIITQLRLLAELEKAAGNGVLDEDDKKDYEELIASIEDLRASRFKRIASSTLLALNYYLEKESRRKNSRTRDA